MSKFTNVSMRGSMCSQGRPWVVGTDGQAEHTCKQEEEREGEREVGKRLSGLVGGWVVGTDGQAEHTCTHKYTGAQMMLASS